MSDRRHLKMPAWLRSIAAFAKLPNLVRKVRDLEREIQQLKIALQLR